MNYMFLGFAFCFLPAAQLFGADNKKQAEIQFPYGDRICGARLLNAIANGTDIEKELKDCNAQGAYIGAFNQAIESSGSHIADPVRHQLFIIGENYGRREEHYSWDSKKMFIKTAAAVVIFSFGGGFGVYKWLQARDRNNFAVHSPRGPKKK